VVRSLTGCSAPEIIVKFSTFHGVKMVTLVALAKLLSYKDCQLWEFFLE
jgi:hypothetical protein